MRALIIEDDRAIADFVADSVRRGTPSPLPPTEKRAWRPRYRTSTTWRSST
jgi:hypothetical protein